jgi:hypothetical protein
MVNSKQLEFLVKLIDDESEPVRDEVLKELTTYGFSLEKDLQEFSGVLDQKKIDLLKPIMEINRRDWLQKVWFDWLEVDDDKKQLESAMNIISKFQLGLAYPVELITLLDNLTEEYKRFYPFGNEIDLANFLFKEKSITGNKDDYYNPLNSNLMNVLQSKKGIPISLSIIYILIGDRLGFDIEGCNFPGHFLAKTHIDDEFVLIDCYNAGRIIYESDLENMINDSLESILAIVHKDTPATTVILRVLNNLVVAYQKIHDKENSDFIQNLISQTPW